MIWKKKDEEWCSCIALVKCCHVSQQGGFVFQLSCSAVENKSAGSYTH